MAEVSISWIMTLPSGCATIVSYVILLVKNGARRLDIFIFVENTLRL